MVEKKKNEIVISKNKELILAFSKLAKRGLEIISELDPRRKHVPNDFPTISEALNHAVDGDTIELAEGLYRESLQITKPVTITGASQSNVIIESPDLSPIFTYHVAHGISKLKNIIIRKADAQDGPLGIDANGEFFEFEHCQFEGFFYSDQYFEILGDNDELWNKYEPCTAVKIGKTDSTASFLHCNFIDCAIGIKMTDSSCINLSNCNFSTIDRLIGDEISIGAARNCKIKSSSSFFSNESIHLGLNTYYESNYDTYLNVDGIITANVSCQAKFSHVTFFSRCLLKVIIWERRGAPINNPIPIWPQGKPKIHFSNSIVFVKDGFKPEIKFTTSGNPGISYDVASLINLEEEGILSYSGKDLLNIPPHFHCQDPLLIFEKNIARLASNSPAIKSASDGYNIGAWQID